MPQEAPLYDLMLLLSNDVEDERRAKIVDDVRQAIGSAGGSVAHDDDWGTRPLAYRIAHQGDAEYHLLQFTGPPALLESLDHTLRITDGVLRFRIIKVLPGTPGPPKPEAVAVAASARGDSAAATRRPAAPPESAAPAASPSSSEAAEPDASTEPDAGAGPEASAGSEAGSEAEAGS